MSRSLRPYFFALLATEIVFVVLHFMFPDSSLFDLDREHTIPAWFSSAQLSAIGLAALVAFAAERQHLEKSPPLRWFWIPLGLGFLYLSADEILGLHERVLTSELRSWLPATSLLQSVLPWQLVFAPGIIGAFTVIATMLYTRFAYDRAGRTLGLAGLVLWSVSFVFEGSAKPLFIPNGLYHLEVALEEASEMLGGTCLLMAFVSYAGRRVFAPAVMPRPHWRPILAASLGTTAVAAAAIGVLTLSNPTYMLRRAGDKFVETTDFARAVAAYGKAVEIDPENRDLWKRLGKAALRARDYPVSANAFERAVGIEADDVSAQNDLGVALYYSGRYQEARVAYEKALELDPKYARAHKNLGVLFEKTGASKDAESEYRAALALDAEMADVHRYLGNLLARGGNTAAAREHWQKSLHLDPRQRSAAELWRRIAEASAPATAAG